MYMNTCEYMCTHVCVFRCIYNTHVYYIHGFMHMVMYNIHTHTHSYIYQSAHTNLLHRLTLQNYGGRRSKSNVHGAGYQEGKVRSRMEPQGVSKAVFSRQNQSISVCYPLSFLENLNSLHRDSQLIKSGSPRIIFLTD